jgi:hypothetical protein
MTKKITVGGEVLFAVLVTLGCCGIVWVLGPSVSGLRIMRLLVAVAAAAQIWRCHQTARRFKSGLFAALALGAVLAPGFLFGWAICLIWSASVVWAYRCLTRASSLVCAGADGFLTCCSIMATAIVASLTESPLLVIWTYLLTQSLLPVVPTTSSMDYGKAGKDRFGSAVSDAERALRMLAVSR